jgi:hypothetical protein
MRCIRNAEEGVGAACVPSKIATTAKGSYAPSLFTMPGTGFGEHPFPRASVNSASDVVSPLPGHTHESFRDQPVASS